MNADASSLRDAAAKLTLPATDPSPAELSLIEEMKRYPAVLAGKLREVENFVLLLVQRGKGEEDVFEPIFAANLPHIARFLDVSPVESRGRVGRRSFERGRCASRGSSQAPWGRSSDAGRRGSSWFCCV